MTSLIALDKTIHRTLKLNVEDPLVLLRSQHLIPLYHLEIIHAGVEFPIVFAKDSETGKFSPAALLGLKPGENLFLREGNWSAKYLPISARPMACIALAKSEDSDELVICIRDDLRHLSETQGEALFEDNGDQTKALLEQSQIAAQIKSFQDLSNDFIEKMLEHKLIESSAITVNPKDEGPYDLNGLYAISEERLNGLSSTEFLELRDMGYLPMLYAVISSKARLPGLLSSKEQL